MTTFVAVDLGASSGRVLVGQVVGPPSAPELSIHELHRRPTNRLDLPDGLHWDLTGTYVGMLDGLRRVRQRVGANEDVSLGIDSWGCDYGLVNERGELAGIPFHYRDTRTDRVVPDVHRRVDAATLYARTGVQHLAINTIFQLADDARAGCLAGTPTMLMIPDLLSFWLTGVRSGEVTNASTTGLLDVATRTWAHDLATAIGIPAAVLPTLYEPGTDVGPLRSTITAETGLPPTTRLVRVGSHDTASAVVGVPAVGDGWAYIACGTWSLVGIEAERPIISAAGRDANFSNEGGVDGRVRYLRNVMGLWLLQESMRVWAARGIAVEVGALVEAAGALPAGGPTIDPDDQRLARPGDIPAMIATMCDEARQRPPQSPAEITRCILDSLAAAYTRAIDRIESLTARRISTIHIVGGGSQNHVLCQLTADTSGRTVLAGPVEATAIGNIVVQARAAGVLGGDLEALRAVVRRSFPLREYVSRAR